MSTIGARTDVGCVRDHNEDSLLVAPPLYVVADGMGGHAAGEVASAIAVKTLKAKLLNSNLSDNRPLSLEQAVLAANDAIINAAANGEGREGMGCTITAAILDGSRLLIAQVGDSRAYLLHDGKLRQLTHDHSYVDELLRAGEITPAEAVTHPDRSKITRALGSVSGSYPDYYELAVEAGDTILLNSDGLSNMVEPELIEHTLANTPDAQHAADELVELARKAGGLDNITTIVVHVTGNEGRVSGALNPRYVACSAEADAESYAAPKRQVKRSPKLAIIAFLLVLVVLVGAAAGALYLYASNAAFLIEEGGYVTVYRGLVGESLPGVKLQWLERTTDVRTDTLLPTTAQRLQEGLQLESLDEANEVLASYVEQGGAASAAQTSAAPFVGSAVTLVDSRPTAKNDRARMTVPRMTEQGGA